MRELKLGNEWREVLRELFLNRTGATCRWAGATCRLTVRAPGRIRVEQSTRILMDFRLRATGNQWPWPEWARARPVKGAPHDRTFKFDHFRECASIVGREGRRSRAQVRLRARVRVRGRARW